MTSSAPQYLLVRSQIPRAKMSHISARLVQRLTGSSMSGLSSHLMLTARSQSLRSSRPDVHWVTASSLGQERRSKGEQSAKQFEVGVKHCSTAQGSADPLTSRGAALSRAARWSQVGSGLRWQYVHRHARAFWEGCRAAGPLCCQLTVGRNILHTRLYSFTAFTQGRSTQ